MGKFAETAIIDYHLWFAAQGKQLPFSISFAASKRKLAVSVFCLQQTIEDAIFH
jgi:hypothetical protein